MLIFKDKFDYDSIELATCSPILTTAGALLS